MVSSVGPSGPLRLLFTIARAFRESEFLRHPGCQQVMDGLAARKASPQRPHQLVGWTATASMLAITILVLGEGKFVLGGPFGPADKVQCHFWIVSFHKKLLYWTEKLFDFLGQTSWQKQA